MDLCTWKWDEGVEFEEVEHALAEKVRDNANVISVVEGVTKVNAFVSIVLVVQGQGGQNSKLDTRCVSILLDRSDDLHRALGLLLPIPCLHHFTKGPLTQRLLNRIYPDVSLCQWTT